MNNPTSIDFLSHRSFRIKNTEGLKIISGRDCFEKDAHPKKKNNIYYFYDGDGEKQEYVYRPKQLLGGICGQAVAQLVEMGFVKLEGKKAVPNFVVFTKEQYEQLTNEVFESLARELKPVYEKLREEVEEYYKKRIQEHLKEYRKLQVDRKGKTLFAVFYYTSIYNFIFLDKIELILHTINGRYLQQTVKK